MNVSGQFQAPVAVLQRKQHPVRIVSQSRGWSKYWQPKTKLGSPQAASLHFPVSSSCSMYEAELYVHTANKITSALKSEKTLFS
jgi:hypothetical protein